MSNRIYFRSGIEQLEEIYENKNSNLNTLESLKEELQHRKSKRAKKLLNLVKHKISDTVAKSPQPEVTKPTEIQPSQPEVTQSAQPETTQTTESTQTSVSDIDWEAELEKANENNEVRETTNIPSKEIKNEPDDLLEAWSVIEVLSPQSYLKNRDLIIGQGDVAPISANALPWPLDKSRPNCRLFYTVYLGAIDLSACTNDLLEIYKDKREEKQNVNGHAALAIVIVDKNGEPLGIDYSAISSFGWSYSRALSGKLNDLKHWDLAEKKLLEGLNKILQRHDKDGKLLALTWSVIIEAHDWLIKNCAIPLRVMSKPEFAIKRFAPFSIGTPEAPLLNSFYLSDLQSARKLVKKDHAGSALQKYLGITSLDIQHDLLEDNDQLKQILEPKNIPLGRWPVKGKFPLVMLQQAAVNITKRDLKEGGLFSVNGPPGTGKTTLLRDVVADVIVDRAIAMSAFNKPADAFTKTKDVIKSQGNKFHIHRIHDSLKGHEMLVASSNNKAVENISRELPLADAIDESANLNYFKPLSDSLLNEDDDSWGLIATVLGNAKNKAKFVDKVWWNKDTSFQSYFEYISGALIYDEDDEGNEIIPSIVEYGSPPKNIHEALDNWQLTKSQFEESLKKVKAIRNMAQEALESELLIKDFNHHKKELQNNSELQKQKISETEESLKALQQTLNIQLSTFEAKKADLREHEKLKFGFWKRLFSRSDWKAWQSKNAELIKQESISHKLIFDTESLTKNKKLECEDLQFIYSDITDELNKLNKKIDLSQEKINQASAYCEHRLITDDSLNVSHEQRQLLNPVFTNEAHDFRDELFVSAVKLHKAFIDAAYRPISQNLLAFMRVLGNKKLPNSDLLPDVWSTGFIISPVFSTAFASINRMLNIMPPQSIGWLLIDEAGQATPQQAVGAIMRSKRVIAVGDPLQIEPVVTTPLPLLEGISNFMGVNHIDWVAPDASVQTLADRSNKYGAVIDKGFSTLWIGSPLLVHRRCDDPMFTISNKLAYNNKMVKATQSKTTDVSQVFDGKTNWFDIKGIGQDKWCSASGDFISKKILEAAELKGDDLDLFVISPFRVVAQNMQERMRKESKILSSYGINNPTNWISKSIGTVHTFQGREAETVILLLGAPNDNHSGARNWAASSVNLMNVAVSRAKSNFYVVGNESLWNEAGKMPVIINEIRRHIRNVSSKKGI